MEAIVDKWILISCLSFTIMVARVLLNQSSYSFTSCRWQQYWTVIDVRLIFRRIGWLKVETHYVYLHGFAELLRLLCGHCLTSKIGDEEDVGAIVA
jgi:hypothetical protein